MESYLNEPFVKKVLVAQQDSFASEAFSVPPPKPYTSTAVEVVSSVNFPEKMMFKCLKHHRKILLRS
jgi:hypothetical protein